MRYVALLRAINVGGRTITMAKLKELFEEFGFSDVSTYIQTGNVVFSSGESDRKKVAQTIEEGMKREVNFHHAAFILTKEDLEKAAKQNPFLKKLNPQVQCSLLFLDTEPAAEKAKELLEMAKPEYEFALRGNVFYYMYEKKWANKRRQIGFEKILGVTGTARTWKVVDKLIEMAKK